MTKPELLRSAAHEINICKHLHGQLDPQKLDFKLCETGRTTLQLLQYLSFCLVEFTRVIRDDIFTSRDWSAYKVARELAGSMEFADFPQILDAQLKQFTAMLDDMSNEDLLHKKARAPWGPNQTKGALLVDISLKFMVAYRMELFLHAKAAGNASLNTGDCWAGTHYEN